MTGAMRISRLKGTNLAASKFTDKWYRSKKAKTLVLLSYTVTKLDCLWSLNPSAAFLPRNPFRPLSATHFFNFLFFDLLARFHILQFNYRFTIFWFFPSAIYASQDVLFFPKKKKDRKWLGIRVIGETVSFRVVTWLPHLTMPSLTQWPFAVVKSCGQNRWQARLICIRPIWYLSDSR